MSFRVMSSRISGWSSLRRSFAAALVLGLASVFTLASVGEGYARLGGGSSFGSRGSRTFSVPSSTATAPRPSAFPSPGFNSGGSFGQRPGGFFSGGFGRGLLGGLVGAGLFGMLFGNGFGGGLGGLSSIFGLILQLGLLYLLFRFVMGFFRNRQPAFGGAAFGQAPPQGGQGGSGFGATAPRGVPITIEAPDYATFEQRLVQLQALYSAEDLDGLRRVATPDMVNHVGQELAGNSRQGVVNRLSDVRMIQGDLSEAWREGSSDFATVAMRFSLIDTMVERASGRVVGGNASVAQIVTELWTFVRASGSGPSAWMLSAIQQG